MKKLFLLINIITILLYASLYPMEQSITEKSLIHKTYPIEQQPRCLMSRFNLVKTYQKYNNPKFDKKELEELENIIKTKIKDELYFFEFYQSHNAKKFLKIINKKNLFTENQTQHFNALLWQYKQSKTITNPDKM
jgi:hypothetical protein